MGGEARLDAWVTFSGEAMRLLILFVVQQKPSDGGLWHPILMQFYSGPLMHLLSGVDTLPRPSPMTPVRQKSPLVLPPALPTPGRIHSRAQPILSSACAYRFGKTSP